MSGQSAKPVLVISDFTCDPLVQALSRQTGRRDISVAPFNQVHQSLDAASRGDHDLVIVWTTPSGVLPAFARAARLDEVDHEQVLAEVDGFAELLGRVADRCPVLMASWSRPMDIAGYGMLDWRPGLGLAGLTAAANLRLADRLASKPDAFVIDSQRWLGSVAGPDSPKLWYAAKVPYRPEVFTAAAMDVVAAMEALAGRSRRLVIVDLDDTLWGGVVGDVGWERIRLGGPDPLGEAFEDFQRALKELTARGIQLGVVSKNTEAVAREAMDRHPSMVLRTADFAGMRINWQDKAANVAALVSELGLGLASVVFIDDNPVERSRVSQALPEVLVPDWPADPMLFAQALRAMRCFTPAAMSTEDRHRTQMYAAQRERTSALSDVGSVQDWLASLETCVQVTRVTEATFTRVAQLLNKTNQLNLRTRRLAEAELRSWAEDPEHELLTVSVSDRFGDLGLVGILGIDFAGQSAQVADFVLSCRAMGRGVEPTMVHALWRACADRGAGDVRLEYVPTERNAPTLAALRDAGLRDDDAHVFIVDERSAPQPPDGVRVDYALDSHPASE